MNDLMDFDTLVSHLAADRAEPIEVILVDETWDRARSLFERVTHRLRVRQRWNTNGTRRAELDNGNVIRLSSAEATKHLHGKSADLVVLTTGAFAIGNVLDNARIVVAASPRGRVVVL